MKWMVSSVSVLLIIAAALGIGQPKPALPKVLLEDSILFLEVGNDVLLMAIEPAGQRDEEDLERA